MSILRETGLRGGKSRRRVDASGATDGEARDAVQHEVIGCISRGVRSSLGGVDGCVAAPAPQLVLLFELASSRGDGRGDAACPPVLTHFLRYVWVHCVTALMGSGKCSRKQVQVRVISRMR